MASTSNAPPPAVIDPRFCVDRPVHLTIARNYLSLSDGSFRISDGHGRTVFTVEGELFSVRDRRILRDGSGNPILTYRKELLSAVSRWQAYRCDESSELLFSVQKSSPVQMRATLDVSLASNVAVGREERADFRIKGSWFEENCVIYDATNPDHVIAKMHREQSGLIFMQIDNFRVTVNPNVDYAFVAALVLILAEIK